MARIFLTGASGYLGGDILYALEHSPLASSTIVCLVRDPKKAEQIQAAYPDVEIVPGDLDSIEVIEKEAERADVALHFASTKHADSTRAIVSGLTSTLRTAQKPGVLIQISGASLFAAKEIVDQRFGQASSISYDDVANVADIRSVINSTPGRDVDRITITQEPSQVRTALIIGPLIYGVGRGPCQPRSIQAPEIAKATIKLGHGIKLLEGENAWSNVHVADVARLVCLLAEAGLDDKNVGWNADGIYCPENGMMTFGELGLRISREAQSQGLTKDAATIEIDAKKADELSPHASILWGTNARITGQRAQKALDWKPTRHSLADEIPDVVKREAMITRA